ncbi:hypothetical protein H7F33_02355 [Pedobacter sp. PAMC26386]|nr:hypothetical protein H7F33_02355 [Pedobacter sp. PAMC26386]
MSTLRQILSRKTDKELLFYVHNVDKHIDEAVSLALAELQKRNVELAENIEEDIKNQVGARAIRQLEGEKNVWTGDMEEYLGAPEYYSQKAIYIFSMLFSVLLGSFMLAVNCRAAGRKMWPVILFGVLYTTFILDFSEYLPWTSTAYLYVVNIAISLTMYELFWNRYLEGNVKYRTNPILIPLIIGLAMTIPSAIITYQAIHK